VGDPASSYTTADVVLWVTDVLKPPHHNKVETPTRKLLYIIFTKIFEKAGSNEMVL